MNTPVTIITTGRVTADLELKTSQNGRNTKFVQFSLAVNKGYGENNRPNYYKCLLFGEEAQRRPGSGRVQETRWLCRLECPSHIVVLELCSY